MCLLTIPFTIPFTPRSLYLGCFVCTRKALSGRVVSTSIALAARSDRLLDWMYKAPGPQQQSCGSSLPACIPHWMRWMHGCIGGSSHPVPSCSSGLERTLHRKPPASGSKPTPCFPQFQDAAVLKLVMLPKPGHAQISWKPWHPGCWLLGSRPFCCKPTAAQLPGDSWTIFDDLRRLCSSGWGLSRACHLTGSVNPSMPLINLPR